MFYVFLGKITGFWEYETTRNIFSGS